jgi:HEXXH motif-containing protein
MAVGAPDNGFAPDAARGARLDRQVRHGLADSLSILFDTLAAAYAVDRPRADALLRRIRAERVGASLFGLYVDLVVAAFDEGTAAIQPLIDDILADALAPPGLRVVTLRDADLGAGQSDRYRRLLRDDLHFTLDPVPDADWPLATGRLGAALALLEAGAPDVLGELLALIGQIVVVSASAAPEGIAFGGASTFSLWGAIALNAEPLGERLAGAVMLAHEAAHCHLFGLALGGRLVENDDDERHPSPLRADSRPLEGVAHATFVTARMIHTLRALLASGALDAAETTAAHARLERNEAAYGAGLATVLANARFTPAGAAAFEALGVLDGPHRAAPR